MMTDDEIDLVEVAEVTQESLNKIWDRIGLSDKERKCETTALLDRVIGVFEEAVESQREEQARLEIGVAGYLKQINTIASQLGKPVSTTDDFESWNLRSKVNHLKQALDILEKKKAVRLDEITKLHNTLHGLWRQLGIKEHSTLSDEREIAKVIPHFKCIGDDMTMDVVERYKQHIDNGEALMEKRQSLVYERTDRLASLWDILGANMSKGVIDSQILQNNMRYTTAFIQQMDRRIGELKEERERRTRRARSLMKDIDRLWQRLRVDQAVRDDFSSLCGYAQKRFTKLTKEVLSKMEGELLRLEDIKKASLKRLILEQREQLSSIWDEINLSTAERNRFTSFGSTQYTDALLNAHEQEVARVGETARKMAPVVKLIREREAILSEKAAFEAKASDPNRLLNRGRGGAQRLLEEEKFRKKLTKRLPRINDVLAKALAHYERTEGKPLKWNGRPYTQIMRDQDAKEIQRQKEDRKRRLDKKEASDASRKIARTPGRPGPSTPRSQVRRTPGRKVKTQPRRVQTARARRTPYKDTPRPGATSRPLRKQARKPTTTTRSTPYKSRPRGPTPIDKENAPFAVGRSHQ